MLEAVVRFPLQLARRVADKLRSGAGSPTDEIRLPIRTNPEGPTHQPDRSPRAHRVPLAPLPPADGAEAAPAATGTAAARPKAAAKKETAKAAAKKETAKKEAAKAAAPRKKKKIPAAPPSKAAPSKAPPAARVAPATPVRIHSEATPNPNAMKFTASVRVVDKGSISFSNAAEAEGHPVGRALFAIEGVSSVFALNDFVTVMKAEGAAWDAVAGEVERVLADVLSAGA